MKKLLLVLMVVVGCGLSTLAQNPPLLLEKDFAAIANEVSGDIAKRNLEGVTQFHRQRGSQGFHQAAELVLSRLKAYGLTDAVILQFPADGKIFYGTQRSRPAWDGEFGELTELTKDGQVRRIASYQAEPVALAEDSESADVTAELIDVGAGTKESDYAGKDVKGKIVLVSAQPGAVQELAIGKFQAAGILSYAQNQSTAWSGDNRDQVRWGHLETFSEHKTFGFMISLNAATTLKNRLAHGETIRLHAAVKAGQHPGNYEVVTATIPGADPKLREQEIAFSCHLDHQRPGANDNASGCVTILEVARTLQKLIAENTLPRPARTIRFIFPPEIEGTLALLNGKPEFAQRIKVAIHMDMVGGNQDTKAVFHVTRGPMSLPSFVHDVAWSFAEWLNQQTYAFAATGNSAYPLLASQGGKEPFRAEYSAYTMGSDHDVYQDSSFAIPSLYFNDWPDRYIHTNLDVPANINATKLKRVGLLGAASGYFLANLSPEQRRSVHGAIEQGQSLRRRIQFERPADAREWSCESLYVNRDSRGTFQSLQGFLGETVEKPKAETPNEPDVRVKVCPLDIYANVEGATERFKRAPTPRGPLTVFGFDYFTAQSAAKGLTTTPKLLEYQGLMGGGEEYAYEVLNFADGTRTAGEIRDAVSTEYGPVPVEYVVEYLRALEKICVVEAVR
jgi:aminopeptidase YwaD